MNFVCTKSAFKHNYYTLRTWWHRNALYRIFVKNKDMDIEVSDFFM